MKATEPIVWQMMRPPTSFYFSNVSAEEILNFPQVASSLPDGIRQKILAEVPRECSRKSPALQIRPPGNISTLIQHYVLGKNPASELLEDLRVLLVRPLETKTVQEMLQAATSPIGTCNPTVNKLKGELDNMKFETKEPNNAAISIFFIAILITGAAHSLPGPLGLPLIDDNVKKSNAPLYFGRQLMNLGRQNFSQLSATTRGSIAHAIHSMLGSSNYAWCAYMRVHMCMSVCMRGCMCVHACLSACVRTCVCMCVPVCDEESRGIDRPTFDQLSI